MYLNNEEIKIIEIFTLGSLQIKTEVVSYFGG